MKLVIPGEAFIVNHLFEDSKFFLEEAKNFDGKDPKKVHDRAQPAIVKLRLCLLLQVG